MGKHPAPAPWTSCAATAPSRLVRAATLLFFGAIALYVLHLANEIMLIGFTGTRMSLAVLSVMTAVIGVKGIFSRIFQTPEER